MAMTLVDTGEQSMTGGRIKRIEKYIKDDEAFCLTYGDGVGDVDISASIAFHHQHGAECTLTAVQPPGRFGALSISSEGSINSFQEKPEGDGGSINGGFCLQTFGDRPHRKRCHRMGTDTP